MLRFSVFVVVVGVLVALGSHSDAQPAAASGTKNLIDVYAESVFNYAVLNNRKPVVVFFGNEKCGACKWMYPQLERLAKNRSEKLYLAKVDTEKLPELAADYGVTEEPFFMTIYFGEIVEVVEGAQWAKVVGLVNNAAKLGQPE